MLERIRAKVRVAHADQVYGNGPYWLHLEDVAKVASDFGYSDDETQMVALLHDVLEDTDTSAETLLTWGATRNAVKAVELLTDSPGQNRKTRKLLTYARMTEAKQKETQYVRLALIVKWSDRLANSRESKKVNPGLYAMYSKEYTVFRRTYMPVGPLAQEVGFLGLLLECDTIFDYKGISE